MRRRPLDGGKHAYHLDLAQGAHTIKKAKRDAGKRNKRDSFERHKPRRKSTRNDAMKTLIALFLAIASAASAQSPLVFVKSYHLTQKQIDWYSVEAMEGSGEAAVKLCNNYFFDRYDPAGARTINGALRWAVIGAEDGNVEAQFRSYQLLSTSTSKLDQTRALFWLKKAAAGHYLGAKAILAKCPSITSTDTSGQPCFGPGSDR